MSLKQAFNRGDVLVLRRPVSEFWPIGEVPAGTVLQVYNVEPVTSKTGNIITYRYTLIRAYRDLVLADYLLISGGTEDVKGYVIRNGVCNINQKDLRRITRLPPCKTMIFLERT